MKVNKLNIKIFCLCFLLISFSVSFSQNKKELISIVNNLKSDSTKLANDVEYLSKKHKKLVEDVSQKQKIYKKNKQRNNNKLSNLYDSLPVNFEKYESLCLETEKINLNTKNLEFEGIKTFELDQFKIPCYCNFGFHHYPQDIWGEYWGEIWMDDKENCDFSKLSDNDLVELAKSYFTNFNNEISALKKLKLNSCYTSLVFDDKRINSELNKFNNIFIESLWDYLDEKNLDGTLNNWLQDNEEINMNVIQFLNDTSGCLQATDKTWGVYKLGTINSSNYYKEFNPIITFLEILNFDLNDETISKIKSLPPDFSKYYSNIIDDFNWAYDKSVKSHNDYNVNFLKFIKEVFPINSQPEEIRFNESSIELLSMSPNFYYCLELKNDNVILRKKDNSGDKTTIYLLKESNWVDIQKPPLTLTSKISKYLPKWFDNAPVLYNLKDSRIDENSEYAGAKTEGNYIFFIGGSEMKFKESSLYSSEKNSELALLSDDRNYVIKIYRYPETRAGAYTEGKITLYYKFNSGYNNGDLITIYSSNLIIEGW